MATEASKLNQIMVPVQRDKLISNVNKKYNIWILSKLIRNTSKTI